MNYKKIIASVMTLMLCSVSCGQTNEPETADTAPVISSSEYEQETVEEQTESEETTEEVTAKETEKVTESKTTTTTESTTDSSTNSTETSNSTVSKNTATNVVTSSTAKNVTTANSANTTANNSTTANTSSNDSNSSNNADSSNNSSAENNDTQPNNDSNNNNTQTENTTSAPVETVQETTAEEVTEPVTEPESLYTAEIVFNESPEVSGEGAYADGNRLTITAGGDYHITGSSSDGQIYVIAHSEEKVKLILDNVTISCSTGPAVFIDDAKKCNIELAEGSYNSFSDSAKDKVNDGVIFSNDTLRIKGTGTLEVNAGNAHGIASDDDVIIEDGNYIINSVKSGIFAHDDITINGGNLVIQGGTNGIKSKGTVNINGGYSVISGGTKEEKSSVYAGVALNYTGGELFAAGNQVTAPATSVNPYIVVDLSSNPPAAGSSVGLVLNGAEQISFNPHNSFRCVIMLSPQITYDSTFTAYINGEASEEFTVTDVQNVFSVN